MKNLSKSARIISAAGILVVLLGVLASAFYFHAGITQAHAAAAAKTIKSHPMRVSPKTLKQGVVSDSGSAPLFPCQTPGAVVRCYTPKQIRQAYDIQRVLDSGDRGQGSTIVIIDAYQSPTIRHDLNLFDRLFGVATSTLNIIAPDGLTPFNPNDPNQVGWSAEISLDVEYAHAIAPQATIDLVLAKSNQDVDILSATKYAIDKNLGDVISQSFGEGESCMDPTLMAEQHVLFQEATMKKITLFASSGDQGAAQPTCDGTSYFLSASTPASDPYVTAVGGTYLNANPQSGNYHGEAAWNDQFGASGGGYSTVYPRPGFQAGFQNHSQRGVPDIAFDADVNGGVLVVWSSSGLGQNLVFIFGGTSVGSPNMAGELALVVTMFGRQGWINPTLYRGFASHGGYSTFFHDITVGDNTFTGAGSNGTVVTINGYNTRQGWDAVTGLGSLILGNTFFGPPGAKTRSQW
ncbi:MAG: S53 family peptidase [Ktedonobacteraceae bacterium]